MTFQVMDNGVVRDATPQEEAEILARQAEAALPLPRRITKLAFRNRFTDIEKMTIELYAVDNPSAALATRQQQAGLRANMADLSAATYIDLDRPDTRAAVLGLEAAGLLGVGRALVILDAEIQPVERYTQ